MRYITNLFKSYLPCAVLLNITYHRADRQIPTALQDVYKRQAYTMPEQGARKVEYANRDDLEESILQYTQTNEEPAEDYSLRAPIKRVIKTD